MTKELQTLGEIRADVVYPLPVFQRLAGLSSWATRQARRNGLILKLVGRRKFITGRDWLAYLDSLETVEG